MYLQLCYEERIQDLETRNLSLQRRVDELSCGGRVKSSEIDSIKEQHQRQVVELEETINSLRQQLLRLHGSSVNDFISSTLLLLCHFWSCTNKSLADFRFADNRCLTIGQLPINTKNFIYLGSGCYPRTLTHFKDCRVQTKQKCTQ